MTKELTITTVPTNNFTAMDSASQERAIKSIRTRGQRLKDDTIKLTNGFLMHYAEHGDMSKAMAIADAIQVAYTKGARKAFLDWCQHFTDSLRWDETSKTLKHKKGSQPKLTTYQGKNHYEVPFFDFIVEEVRPVNFAKSQVNTIKRGIKGLEEGTAEDYERKDILEAINLSVKMGWAKQDDFTDFIVASNQVANKARLENPQV